MVPGSRWGGHGGGHAKCNTDRGGVLHQQQEGCYIPLFHLSPPLFGFFVLDRLTRAAPAEREKTGATPPFLPLVRHGEGGVLHPVLHRV